MPKKTDQRPINPLTPEMLELSGLLKAKREELHLSDQAFHRKFLHLSYTTWYRWSSDTYVGDVSKVYEVYKSDYKHICSIKTFAPKIEDNEPFYEFDVFRAVTEAVRRAHEAKDENRLVVFLAPTGGGKDAVCRHLKSNFNAVVVEGKESWRKSYHASCSDVLQAMGIKGSWKSTRAAETEMLMELNKDAGTFKEPYTLIANEGNTFGPHTFNMFKLILNQTNAVVVICAIPEIFDRMKYKSWFESAQFIRRAVAVIKAPDIQHKEILPFLEPFNLNGAREHACQAIAAAANSFGRFNMVKRVIANIAENSRYAKGKEVPVTAVERAIAEAQAFLGELNR